jgi:[ribosomal protein S18]-alanine N-acetyltransferase
MCIMFGGATRSRIGKIPRRNDMTLPSADFVIRPLNRNDAGALAALELRCAGAADWGESAYRDIELNGIRGWSAARGSELVGFIAVRSVADETEILNLGVNPDARRQGIAARLLAAAIDEDRRAGVRTVYLEVRESNAGARAFYCSAGFVHQGRRKSYYSQPAEDALVLSMRLD